VIIYWNI